MIFIEYKYTENRRCIQHARTRRFLTYVCLFSAQRNQCLNVFSLREHIVRRYG